MITAIEAASPADFARLRRGFETIVVGDYEIPIGGDVILAIDGVRVESMRQLVLYLDTLTSVGDTVELTIFRDGERLVVPIVVGERPPWS